MLLDQENFNGNPLKDSEWTPTYIYAGKVSVNICCETSFGDHKTWLEHVNKKHAGKSRIYLCGKCNVSFDKITRVSPHFPKCHGSREAAPVVDLEFKCPYCDKSFGKKTGLGVHKRSKHPNELDAERPVDRKNERWSSEEVHELAAREARLPSKLHVNIQLQNYFPHRTREAIKGQRKLMSYKQLVSEQENSLFTLSEEEELLESGNEEEPVFEEQTPNRVVVPEANSESLNCIITGFNEGTFSTAECLAKLDTWLLDNMQRKLPKPPKVSSACNDNKVFSKRQIKRQRYARFQRLWRKNKKELLKEVEKGSVESDTPSETDVRNVYQKLFESPSPKDDAPLTHIKTPNSTLMHLIDAKEIEVQIKILADKACGVDGMKKADLVDMDKKDLVGLLNLLVQLKEHPASLKLNRTILLPKGTTGLSEATNWRPISISSILVRLLHRIMSQRLLKAVNLNRRQRAFIPADGCFENVMLLDHVVKRARKTPCELDIFGIDLSKAFDSVSRHSVTRALRRQGIEEDFVTYTTNVFNGCTTEISVGTVKIPGVSLTRGVKQGDCLSPLLFNLMLDELLDDLPDHIGVEIGGCKINALGFADDIILLASSKAGMRFLIQKTEEFFGLRSMKINAKKCFSLRLVQAVGTKSITNDTKTTFSIAGGKVTPCSVGKAFKYLGIQFDPTGKLSLAKSDLDEMLKKLSLAPLKPQQKLVLLKSYVIPRYLHKLVLGRITKGLLTSLDMCVKAKVKEWLRLPADVADGFLYASQKNGGLGIPKLSLQIPILILKRLRKLAKSEDPVLAELCNSDQIAKLLSKCNEMIPFNGLQQEVNFAAELQKDTNAKWFGTTDGRPLKQIVNNTRGQEWVSGHMACITGSQFINLCKLRSGRLPTKEVSNRGRPGDKSCRYCKNRTETLNHVVQGCAISHYPRIRRHNWIVDKLKELALKAGITTFHEQWLHPEDGPRARPDLLFVKNDICYVVDVQVTSDSDESLTSAHNEKIKTYTRCDAAIKNLTAANTIEHWPFILTNRGLYHEHNDRVLRLLKAKSSRSIIVLESMLKSIMIHTQFMRQTSTADIAI